MSRLIKSAALLAALALAAPAALADRPVIQNVKVSYGDLNLQSEAGVDALFSRISNATRKVCGGRPETILAGALTRYLACRDRVMDETVRRIDVPGITVAWTTRHAASTQIASR